MRRDALLVVSGLSLSYGEGSCNSTPYFYLLSIVLLSERDYGEERACLKGVMVETEIKIVEILFVLVPFLTHTLKKFFFFSFSHILLSVSLLLNFLDIDICFPSLLRGAHRATTQRLNC